MQIDWEFIKLLLSGLVLVAGATWHLSMRINDVMANTNTKVKELKGEVDADRQKMRQDISDELLRIDSVFGERVKGVYRRLDDVSDRSKDEFRSKEVCSILHEQQNRQFTQVMAMITDVQTDLKMILRNGKSSSSSSGGVNEGK